MKKAILLFLSFGFIGCGIDPENLDGGISYDGYHPRANDNHTASFSMNWEAEMGYPVEQVEYN